MMKARRPTRGYRASTAREKVGTENGVRLGMSRERKEKKSVKSEQLFKTGWLGWKQKQCRTPSQSTTMSQTAHHCSRRLESSMKMYSKTCCLTHRSVPRCRSILKYNPPPIIITQSTVMQDPQQHHAFAFERERVAKLEQALRLKETELANTQSHQAGLKQQYQGRINQLENTNQILQSELTEQRRQRVRDGKRHSEQQARIVSENSIRYNQTLEQQQRNHQEQLKQQEERHLFEIGSIEKRHQQMLALQRAESNSVEVVSKQFSSHQSSTHLQMQQENARLRAQRRQAQQRAAESKEVMERLRQHYQQQIDSLQESIEKARAETEGGMIQQRLLREELAEEKERRRSVAHAKQTEINELALRIEVKQRENQDARELLSHKDEEILTQLGRLQDERASQKSTLPVEYPCNHIPLLKQYQRALKLQEQELGELRGTLAEWRETIGFEKSIKQRVKEISVKSNMTSRLNQSLSRTLKQRNK